MGKSTLNPWPSTMEMICMFRSRSYLYLMITFGQMSCYSIDKNIDEAGCDVIDLMVIVLNQPRLIFFLLL
jgi:hypothetical protein